MPPSAVYQDVVNRNHQLASAPCAGQQLAPTTRTHAHTQPTGDWQDGGAVGLQPKCLLSAPIQELPNQLQPHAVKPQQVQHEPQVRHLAQHCQVQGCVAIRGSGALVCRPWSVAWWERLHLLWYHMLCHTYG